MAVATNQAKSWIQKYEAAEKLLGQAREEARKLLREEIEDSEVEHVTQNELRGYPFYDFQVFVFPDRSIYVESEAWSKTYGSPEDFANDLVVAHSKVIEKIRTPRKPIVVAAVVEFEIDPNEVDDGDETKLVSDLVGECVKVKSGAFENRFMGNIVSARVEKETTEKATAVTTTCNEWHRARKLDEQRVGQIYFGGGTER